MSDDPRGYRRGYPGNPRNDNDVRGRGPAEASGERSNAGSKIPSFSAYRPEAYASPEPRSVNRPERSDMRNNVSMNPQQQRQHLSPVDETWRQERPAPTQRPQQDRGTVQQDPRDPYRSPDPYATRQDYETDWRAAPPRNNRYDHEETPPPPPVDAFAMHDRFFADEDEHEAPAPTYRDTRRDEPVREKPAPRGYAADNRGAHAWEDDTFEQSPAPASLRPNQLPATIPAPHDDDMDADFFDEDEFDDDYYEEKRGGRTRLIAAVLVGAIVTGGGLGWLYTGGFKSGNHAATEAGIVRADTAPVKETPQESGGRQFASGKQIQDRLGGAPVQMAAAEPTRQVQPAAGVTASSNDTLEERINNALNSGKERETASSVPETTINEPKPVSTVTVNVDGSIAENNAGQSIGSASKRVAVQPTETESSLPARIEEAPAASAPAEMATEAPAEEPSRPTASAPAQVAQAQPAQASVLTEGTSGTGSYFVQLGARNDEAAATAAFTTMQQKYSSVLAGYTPSMQKAEIPGKGTWYRLRIGPFGSKAEADKVAENLKTAGLKGPYSVKD